MRINLLFILLLSAFSAISAKPVLALSEEIVDFGEVNIADGSQTRMLVVKNEGDEPLVVNQVSSTCHCVEPEWSIKPIAPASTDSIKIVLNPDGSGMISKKLIVYSNAKNKRTVFRVKAKAIRKK
ncbi:MAG: DUF1573 domain-containing protein [Bacteroidales bacterium]|nr:DUF1573 domain-containing protein [Candidatus Scybalocola fimicaballi]